MNGKSQWEVPAAIAKAMAKEEERQRKKEVRVCSEVMS